MTATTKTTVVEETVAYAEPVQAEPKKSALEELSENYDSDIVLAPE